MSQYKKNDFFNIKYIFIFLFIYFVLIPYLFSGFNTIPSILTLVISLYGYSAFLLGYRTKTYFKIAPRVESKKRIFIFTFTSICFIFHDTVFGFLSLFNVGTGLEYTNSFKTKDYGSLYLQIIELCVLTFKYFCFSLFITNNKKRYYLVFISQVILLITSPTRLMALYPFIVFVIYGYYHGMIVVNYKRVILTFISLPFLFVVMLLFRGANKLSYVDNVKSILSGFSWESFTSILKVALESFQSYHYLVEIINNNFVHVSSGVFRLLFMFVPRSIWSDKPEAISRIISYEYNNIQYVQGGGSVATIFGDAFINGHLLGVTILLFILGYISKIILNTRNRNIKCSVYQKSILYMYYAIYIFQFIYYFRGFFSESLWKIIIITAVFWLFYKLSFKKVHQK